MWKRGQTTSPENNSTPTPAQDISTSSPPRTERVVDNKTMANIGKSVIINGELKGSEDLSIEGQVEGKIELKDHLLTIGQNGRIRAEIHAKSVVVHGQVIGNIIAAERVIIREHGSVDGDIIAPRVSIAEGALFKGKIDMHSSQTGAPPCQTPAELEPKQPAEAIAKKDKAGEKLKPDSV